MKTSIEYLDACKRALGGISDYRLARELGVVQATISKLRVGKSTLGDETAIRIARVLGLPPAQVIADAHAERAAGDEMRAVWASISEKFSASFRRLASNATLGFR